MDKALKTGIAQRGLRQQLRAGDVHPGVHFILVTRLAESSRDMKDVGGAARCGFHHRRVEDIAPKPLHGHVLQLLQVGRSARDGPHLQAGGGQFPGQHRAGESRGPRDQHRCSGGYGAGRVSLGEQRRGGLIFSALHAQNNRRSPQASQADNARQPFQGAGDGTAAQGAVQHHRPEKLSRAPPPLEAGGAEGGGDFAVAEKAESPGVAFQFELGREKPAGQAIQALAGGIVHHYRLARHPA